MAENLVLYHLLGSPNNMKVRAALGYKGLDYDVVPVNPQDRSEVVKVSGQPLTPVLMHGERAIFDSHAIVRYLDAQFRETPSIFAAEYSKIKEIEKWETWTKQELGAPIGMIFRQAGCGEYDAAGVAKANALLAELTAKLEEALAESDWLVDGRLTAADLTAAPFVVLSMLPAAAATVSPISKFFHENLELGEGREKTRAWVGRVMAHDGQFRIG